MSTVWLALGSNLGNRKEHIEKAVASLSTLLEDMRSAPLYESAPMDFLKQPAFLNTVVRGITPVEPLELLGMIQHIELEGGRQRGNAPPKGPRTIDIDVLMIDDLVGTWGRVGELTIPHISMQDRLFVLKPLLELDPDLVDPRDGLSWRIKASNVWAQEVKLYRT